MMENKKSFYSLLNKQFAALIDGEENLIANLSNASALLFDNLPDVNWAGFYLANGNELILGPFCGKPACVRIPAGKGVCGTAMAQKNAQVVYDVHEFPGHIACDCASNSEIVVPIIIEEKVYGVLDIDSPSKGTFDSEDLDGLQEFVDILIKSTNWQWPGITAYC